MTDYLDLIQRYEPVLLFSKDGDGNPENFFPMAAEHFVRECGLRRKGKDAWLHKPGATLPEHLAKVNKSEDCYLVYAVSEASESDSDLPLRLLLDYGLEFARVGDSLVPRALVSHREADALEKSIAEHRVEWQMNRRPLEALITKGLSSDVGEALTSLSGLELPSEWEGVGWEAPDEEGLAWIGEVEDPSVLAALEAALGILPSPDEYVEVSPLVRLYGTDNVRSQLEWFTLSSAAIQWDPILDVALAKYKPHLDKQPVYHWHAWEDEKTGWCVLQYWLLYAFNDWAAHGGSNVHEGDWELVCVFLDEKREPRWVASSVHILKPKKEKWGELEARGSIQGGTHPVIFVGCGSHAGYLERRPNEEKGPYKYWLRRYYYDYATGDSISIGPAGADVDRSWGEPIWLDKEPWNTAFKGNWGALLKHWLGKIGRAGSEGPTGPAQKGTKWNRPDRWAFGLLGLWAAGAT